MRTAEAGAPPTGAVASAGASSRFRRAVGALAGPALVVVLVLVTMRGFVLQDNLTNQHPDILSFWLPRSCLLGRSLAAGHVPLWNPFEMAGTPFATDPQSGWLYLPSMLLSWLLGCGSGLRALIVLNPILGGLGLMWFLRKEGLHRAAATAGGLSLAMSVAASNVAISLPFAGTLAWTPFALVGASGWFSAERWPRRLAWIALSALAWGQVASAHLSHGLVMATGLLAAYVIARAMHEVRGGALDLRRAVALGLAFMTFLPLANLAILIPRFELIVHSSLRGGYAALGGTLARAAGVYEDRPLPTRGVWSGWPFSLGVTPGAYAGAAILLCMPAAFRAKRHRYLAAAVGAVGLVGYLLTLTLFVGAGWFRGLMLALPFGDVYLHNPARLRYLSLIVAPVLGAVGIQGFFERLPSRREAAWWIGGGGALFLGLPLALGADPVRFVVLASAIVVTAPVLLWMFRGRRWAVVALPAVLAADLLAGALWSTTYEGGTVYVGLEPAQRPALAAQPLRWPEVSLDCYLEPEAIARYLQRQGSGDGRYLAWIPPAAYFNKGYLFTQKQTDWPALLLGRAVLFRLEDAFGYSPIQLPRYWSYIRATDRLPVYYNASVLQLPSLEDVRLLGVRFLVVAEGVGLPPGLSGTRVTAGDGYALFEVEGWEPRASLVADWRTVDGPAALQAVLTPGFGASEAVVEGDPGIVPSPDVAAAGSAAYREAWPEDVSVEIDAAVPSILVVRNAWDRGWSATVDGRPTPVLRTDYFLQGVPVPAGHHEVRLTYTDPSIGRGLISSAAVWLVWGATLLVVAVRSRRSFTRSAAAEPPSPA